jgi:hypothetical protein
MTAMQSWVEERQYNPGALEPSTVEEFTSWVEERAEVSGNTASLFTGGSELNWTSD